MSRSRRPSAYSNRRRRGEGAVNKNPEEAAEATEGGRPPAGNSVYMLMPRLLMYASLRLRPAPPRKAPPVAATARTRESRRETRQADLGRQEWMWLREDFSGEE